MIAFPPAFTPIRFIVIVPFVMALLGCRGEQRLSEPAPDAGSAWISGTVELHPGLLSEVPSGARLTLTLFPADAAAPGDMPIARVESAMVHFPFRFTLSEQARLRGPAFDGLPMAGKMLLRAHVGRAAFAAPAPGDLVGEVQVERGQQGVSLLIDGRVAAP